MHVARPHVSPENRREPTQLHWFPDRDSTEHDDRRDDGHREVRGLLQSVVLSLVGMLFARERIKLDHLPHAVYVATSRRELAPLPMQVEKAEIDKRVDDENPHDREVPMAGASQPAAERQSRGNRLFCERIAAEPPPPPGGGGEPGGKGAAPPDHPRQTDDIEPKPDARDPNTAVLE